MREKTPDTLKIIGAQFGFAQFDMRLSDEDCATLESAVIGGTISLEHFGALDELSTDIVGFMQRLGNAPLQADSLSDIIYTKICDVHDAFAADSSWVSLRAMLPKDVATLQASGPAGGPYVPRWHLDGYLFDHADAPEQYKVVSVFKGDQMLTAQPDPALREAFLHALSDEEHTWNLEKRKKVSDALKNPAPVTAQPGNGVLMRVGHPQHAGIHSEPEVTQPRLFLSVVPGTAAQVEKLCHNWYGDTIATRKNSDPQPFFKRFVM